MYFHAHTHAHTCAHTHHTRAHLRTHAHTCTRVRTHMCKTRTHMRTCSRAHTLTHAHARMHMCTHVHTRAHTHTHTKGRWTCTFTHSQQVTVLLGDGESTVLPLFNQLCSSGHISKNIWSSQIGLEGSRKKCKQIWVESEGWWDLGKGINMIKTYKKFLKN